MTSLSAFLSASGVLPPASLPGSCVLSERKTILSAFSSLDLQLQEGPSGEVMVKSSARDLLDQRRNEKAREEVLQQQYDVKKQQQQQQRQQQKKPAASALNQALATFATETEGGYFVPKSGGAVPRKGSRPMSRRARLKYEANKEKGENYSGKITTRSTQQVKRQERKEKYKRVY